MGRPGPEDAVLYAARWEHDITDCTVLLDPTARGSSMVVPYRQRGACGAPALGEPGMIWELCCRAAWLLQERPLTRC